MLFSTYRDEDPDPLIFILPDPLLFSLFYLSNKNPEGSGDGEGTQKHRQRLGKQF